MSVPARAVVGCGRQAHSSASARIKDNRRFFIALTFSNGRSAGRTRICTSVHIDCGKTAGRISGLGRGLILSAHEYFISVLVLYHRFTCGSRDLRIFLWFFPKFPVIRKQTALVLTDGPGSGFICLSPSALRCVMISRSSMQTPRPQVRMVLSINNKTPSH